MTNAVQIAFERMTGIPDAWTNPALIQSRNGFIQGWGAALAEQVPVAWIDPATLTNLIDGVEDVYLVYEVEMVNSVPLYAIGQ